MESPTQATSGEDGASMLMIPTNENKVETAANHYNYNYTAVGIVKGLALVELLVYIPVPLYV